MIDPNFSPQRKHKPFCCRSAHSSSESHRVPLLLGPDDDAAPPPPTELELDLMCVTEGPRLVVGPDSTLTPLLDLCKLGRT